MPMSLKVSVSGVRGSHRSPRSRRRVAGALGERLRPSGFARGARGRRAGFAAVGADGRRPRCRPGSMSTGHDVIDAGIDHAHRTEYAGPGDHDAVGGVIVTASHNPVEWNALKLLDAATGLFLSAEMDDAAGRGVLYEKDAAAHVDRDVGPVRPAT